MTTPSDTPATPVRHGAGWNDARAEVVRSLWAQGASASQIAARLGDVTRNAVIGKVHRLGLSERLSKDKMRWLAPPQITTRAKQRAERAKQQARRQWAGKKAPGPTVDGRCCNGRQHSIRPPEPKPEPIAATNYVEVDVPLGKRVQLPDRPDRQCRWIIGDPRTPEHHYCHHDRQGGQSYCAHHGPRTLMPPMRHRPLSQIANIRWVDVSLRKFRYDQMAAVTELIDERPD